MKQLSSLILLLAVTVGSATAATSGNPITLEITFSLSDSLAIAWADDAAGLNPIDAQTWAIGAVSLSGTYNTTAASGFKHYIVNESPTDTSTDVYAQISTVPANWADHATTPGQDTYVLLMDAVGGDTDYETVLTDSSQTKFDTLTDNADATPKLEFQFQTPTSILNGNNGSSLRIIVTFTATVATASAPTVITVTEE